MKLIHAGEREGGSYLLSQLDTHTISDTMCNVSSSCGRTVNKINPTVAVCETSLLISGNPLLVL